MLLIYSEEVTSRCRYVFDWIAGQWGIGYMTISDKEEFLRSTQPRIWYGKLRPVEEKGHFVFASGLLHERGVEQKDVKVRDNSGVPELFFNENDLEFDVFGAVFFMLTRYEEYGPFKPDRHGRFPGRRSIAFKNKFLRLPVVDIWVGRLREELKCRFPELEFPVERFQTLMSYDLDVAYKFAGRRPWRKITGCMRDIVNLNFKRLGDRIAVQFFHRKDPWDIYVRLEKILGRSKLKSIFFIPAGKRSKYDRNLSPEQPQVSTLIRHLHSFASVALHPTYQTSENKLLIEKEKKVLERALGTEISSSRQHFLRFRLPDTFRAISESGIECDYSMSFPDAPGFRAGTCKPFYLYDLKNETTLALKIYSPCWMDSTFLHYHQSGHESAVRTAFNLLEEVKKVGGFFIPIFHNNDLAEGEGIKIHNKIVEKVLQLQTQ